MSENPLLKQEDDLLATIRSILLKEVQDQLQKIEGRILHLQENHNIQGEEQQKYWADLQSELDRLSKLAGANEKLSKKLYEDLQDLQQEALTDPEKITSRLTPMMTNLIRGTIHDSHDEMAEALGPVMSEAVRVQIRDSRQDMIDALYPIIGDTVQRAIGEFARELQRNIDARLKSVLGPQGFWRTIWARLRGVSPGELALRDALPFSIQEVFIIQHGSGMLINHYHSDGDEAVDSDLVSAMLTAIRDFGRDAFNQGEELDEIQYGDGRILLQSGKHAYLAVLIDGVEPEGFRAAMHDYISELHVRHSNVLRDYDGDPALLPDLSPGMSEFVAETSDIGKPEQQAMSKQQRLVLVGLSVLILIIVSLACFYAVFTAALLPVAFPGPTETTSPTIVYTNTIIPSPTSTSTNTPTPTNTATSTATYTLTPTNTAMPTSTPKKLTPTGTLAPQAYLKGNVWVRDGPIESAPRSRVIPNGTPVTVLAVYGDWAKVEWDQAGSIQQGWVPQAWLILPEQIPPELVTPGPTKIP